MVKSWQCHTAQPSSSGSHLPLLQVCNKSAFGFGVQSVLQAPMHTRSLATLKQQIVRSALKKSAPITPAAAAQVSSTHSWAHAMHCCMVHLWHAASPQNAHASTKDLQQPILKLMLRSC